jgi:hypothetical protein
VSWWKRRSRAERRRIEVDVDDEIAAHIEMKARDLERQGLSRSDALAGAERLRVDPQCFDRPDPQASQRRDQACGQADRDHDANGGEEQQRPDRE